MSFLKALLGLSLLGLQVACSTSMEPISETPAVLIVKGSLGGGSSKAELFEDDRLQRSTKDDFDQEAIVHVEQLRSGAFLAARDYLLNNPVLPRNDNLECDAYTAAAYVPAEGPEVRYYAECSHQPMEDHFKALEDIIQGFSNKSPRDFELLL